MICNVRTRTANNSSLLTIEEFLWIRMELKELMCCTHAAGKPERTDDTSDNEDEGEAGRQRRQARQQFRPAPYQTTRLAGEHISVTLAPGVSQVPPSSQSPSCDIPFLAVLQILSAEPSPSPLPRHRRKARSHKS